MRKPLRILFAIGSLAGGGSERQLVTILQHLDRSRFEPTLYLLSRAGAFLKDVPENVRVIAFDDDPHTSRFYVPGSIYRRQVAHLTEMLRDGDFDLLYDRTILMACVAGPAARRAGIRRVAAVVANPDRDMQATFRRFGWLKRRILATGYRDAARVVANSEALRDSVAKHFLLPEERTTMIPNGFDVAAIRHHAEAEPPVALDSNLVHITAMGRFGPEKGFPDLLRAVRHLVLEQQRQDLVLWLLGAGPEEPLYRQLIAEEPSISRHVRMPGFAPNPFAILSRVRLFCMSSHYEGSPNALVEAIACGVPVVSTDCPYGPREILDGGRYGELTPVSDWRAMADAIERVLDDESAALKRAELARESIRDRFDAQRSTARLEQLFEAVASNHGQSR